MNSYVYSTNSSSVKYKWIIRDVILFVIFFVQGLTLLKTTGDVTVYFRYKVLDGQFLYIISKILGLYAFVFLWLQVLQGLLGVQKNAMVHRNQGLLILSLFLAHAVLFICAASVRNKHFASGLLLPHFFGLYLPSIQSLGLIASWFMILGAGFAFLRKFVARFWKWGHRLFLPAFFLVFFHSYLIGSETRTGAMIYIYFFMLITVTGAIGYRIGKYRIVRDAR